MPAAVNWPQSTDARFAELEATTGIGVALWRDALTLPPPDFAQWVTDMQALGHMSWARQADKWAEFVAIAEAIGVAASVVSGVAGAVTAVAALRSL